MRTIAAVLLVLALAGCRGENDFRKSMEAVILPAEEYQQEIAAVDQLLFREEALGEEGARDLEKGLAALATRVRKSPEARSIEAETAELQRLGERAGRLSPAGTAQELRTDWMRLRKKLFNDRAWFVRSVADLEYVASLPPAAQIDEPPPKVIQATPVYESRFELTGKWRVLSVTANGKPRVDREITGATWTFDAKRLVMRTVDGHESTFKFTPEGNYVNVSGLGSEGSILYDLVAGELRVAFYDGLNGKPGSFTPDPAGKGPLLVVVRLAAVQ